MEYLILAFFSSLLVTLVLIRYQHLHEKISHDHDLSGPQKFHTHAVPRIGGIGIFLALLISGVVALNFSNPEKGTLLLQLSACALPTFFIGLTEDLTKKIGVKIRLLATASSALLSGYALNVWVTQIQIPGIDWLLSIAIIAIIFTVIAVTGLANAYNIIDGFNGLASMIAIISLLAIGYVAFKANDPILASIALIVIGAISGFFIWNYPRGLIFLGDGGAYLIGFLIATLSILLVNRNPSVSPWFALLVNAYPIFETLFTIWRRKVHQGKNPGLPDGAHFHSLIYRRMIRWAEVSESQATASFAKNARTSPYLWLLSSLAVFPAIIWWQTTWILQCFALLFCVSYVWVYGAIVKFKTPSLFKFFK
ncbi:glycosyltransferase family 4 protein [Polynucleobacter sp. MWH-Spelu-300-X4]|uniref:MraY family glycosyltransferase n=1 Tax=Polynucleobacter sp. MWH-Spelu-300-X4 TaxID=2689109 RepID=UPI001BFDFDB9|nr:glycosyltransferase [Polynucleobacter sp. MWH-Spelu-300-X4]QWD80035.1 glycosyltransferase family 4 protein [Polynucleobacter sp. MWH-Spelu-300-X4]